MHYVCVCFSVLMCKISSNEHILHRGALRNSDGNCLDKMGQRAGGKVCDGNFSKNEKKYLCVLFYIIGFIRIVRNDNCMTT